MLDYFEEAGGVAMPPEFGIYDVLLPEEVAAKLALNEESPHRLCQPPGR